jgi:hypothetical protein
MASTTAQHSAANKDFSIIAATLIALLLVRLLLLDQ